MGKIIIGVFAVLLLALSVNAANYVWEGEEYVDDPFGHNFIDDFEKPEIKKYCGCHKRFSAWSETFKEVQHGCNKRFSSWSQNFKEDFGYCAGNKHFSSWSKNYRRNHAGCC